MACANGTVWQIPGPAGASGANGIAGVDGLNAFSVVALGAIAPIVAGSVTVTVDDSSWFALGDPVFVEFWGFYLVTAVPSSTSVTLQNLGLGGGGGGGGGGGLPAGVGGVIQDAENPPVTVPPIPSVGWLHYQNGTGTLNQWDVPSQQWDPGGGGGGGGGGVGFGAVIGGVANPPVAPPSDPTLSWLYTVYGTGTIYSWDVPSQTWI